MLRSLLVFACCSAAALTAVQGGAQGVTTGAIRGKVMAADGTNIDGSRIRVVNAATGFSVDADVRQGGFLVQGLDVGGSYTVTVTRVGFRPERLEGIALRLGAPAELRIVLHPLATPVSSVIATGMAVAPINAHGGTVTTISDSLVHRLPTPDRNVFDFVRLAPHVSTKVGRQRNGVSAAGANLRFNSFLIDGVEERFVQGSISTAQNLGKSIPVDAVKEYQVLVAPYDVRYGDFAGALINTVTTAGTNALHGATFATWRNDRLAPAGEAEADIPYDRLQYGFALGGPIVRDRVHFFIAPEIQRVTSPTQGPFLGQSSTATPPVPLTAADAERLERIMRGHGLQSGSAGAVELSNPLRNLFARIDALIPSWRSRASAFVTYAAGENQLFSRAAPDTFSLSSYKYATATGLRMIAARLHTDLARAGGHNEVLVSHSEDWGDFLPTVRQPLVRVLMADPGGGLVTINAGPAEPLHGRFGRAWSMRVRDDLSLPLGADHILRLGVQAERFRTTRGGVIGGYGVWTFAGLDALEQGLAGRYELRKSLDDETISLGGGQYAAWIGDEWRITDRATITMGVRADRLAVSDKAPRNAAVEATFGRRTDVMPRARVHVSPRIGFTVDLSERDLLRGGVGVFTGRPPLAWFVPGVASYGLGIGVLRCGLSQNDAGVPPPFVADYREAPTACATGPGLVTAPLGDVDLLDRNLRMAESLRASLAYDRRLPWGLLSTSEVLVSRHLTDFMFVNLNLEGPRATDRFGRVLYGTIGENGVPTPAVRSGFSEVIDLKNTTKNYSYQLSTRVEKQFTGGVGTAASYTHSRVRDVQSPSRVNLAGIALWGDARAVSGRHDESALGISLNDIPHRLVLALTFKAPWDAPTDVSVYYVGESGTPFTYVAGGVSRRGDLNADGSNINDPIYVPRDVTDPNEILFSGLSSASGADNSPSAQAARVSAQQTSFGNFIDVSPCLDQSRGRILGRNRCREPWSHTTVASIRQAIPMGGHSVEIALDVFNVLNLINRSWGQYRIATSQQLLEQVGQTAGPAGTTQPIFRLDTTRSQWTAVQSESVRQLQLTARYSF